MTTRIIIARHGNTFAKDETPRRVGGRTDLDLVEEERGRNVGRYLKAKGLIPALVFAAPLKRTVNTAKLAIEEMGGGMPLEIDDSFREVDYGPDENKTDDEVMLRLGQVYAAKEGKNPAEMSEDALTDVGRHVIDLWNEKAIVPDGWKVSPEDCIHAWMKFGEKVFKNFHGENIMVVSSNGVIRFVPYLTGDFNGFAGEHDIKVTTGGVCVFEREDDEENWHCTEWNVKPKKYFESLPD